MRILLDTNTLFSALLTEGNERQLVDKAISGPHTLVFTDLIEEQAGRVFFRKLSPARAKKAQESFRILKRSKFVYTKSREQYERNLKHARKLINEKDTPILAAGLQEEINAIVTGDKGFLENPKLKNLRGKKIFSTREFLTRL